MCNKNVELKKHLTFLLNFTNKKYQIVHFKSRLGQTNLKN